MADNVEIQGLEFQIVNDSTQIVKGLEDLKNTLGRLRTACGSAATGLSGTAKSVRELKNALQGLNIGETTQKFNRIYTSLSRFENLKPFRSTVNSITKLNTALSQLKWTDGDKLATLANGMQPLSELGRSRLTSFINQLGKLPAVITELEKADIDKFSRQMTDLAAAMKPFADEMQKVSNGFSAFPSRIQRLITTTEQYNGTVRKATNNTELFKTAVGGLKFAAVWQLARRAGNLIGTAITKSNEYQENLNLFTVAMGEYAESALEYANVVSDALGIDVSDWIRNQGIFMTLGTGLGVASDKSAIMSKNLTQLGYDISSFFNISVEDAMQKLQSAISGELEPVRRLGYALSQNNLQELYGKEVTLALSKAYSELENSMSDAGLAALAAEQGYNRNISAMTEAEKVQLRYIALMKQNSIVQGDLARTLEAPANQLRILKAQFNMCAREIGNIFIPILNKILPYAIAAIKVIRELANSLAQLVGFTLTDVDYSNVNRISGGVGDLADNLSDAAGAAKKLKQYTAGFDELNVFSPDSGSSVAGDIENAIGGGFDFELPEYNFIDKAISNSASDLEDQMRDILTVVASIGAAMASWAVAKSVLEFMQTAKQLSGRSFNFKFGIAGLGLFLDGWNKIKEALQDIRDNGANLENVPKLISGFAEDMGAAFLILGNVKMAGVSLIISGISGMVSDIANIANNGINWDNATSFARNLGIFLSGLSLAAGKLDYAGYAMIFTGIVTLVRNAESVLEAIRTGNWEGVDKVELAAGALMVFSGYLLTVGKFKTIADTVNSVGAVKSMTQTVQVTGELETATANLSPKLAGLAKNLGMGVVIITEVAAAAVIFTGAIALIGWELGKIKDEWKPVIDSGEEVATSILVGTGLLVAIGLAAAGLGTITIASAGTLPLAIGIGAGVLAELAGAFIVFSESLIVVADELSGKVAPALDRMNTKLPKLKDDMSAFSKYMVSFSEEVTSYTKSMGNITWSSIVSGFQKLFAGDPIASLADDIGGIYDDTKDLNDKLKQANPELELAITLMTSYTAFMSQLQILTKSGNDASTLSLNMFTNLKTVGENLVTGFATGIGNKISVAQGKANELKVAVLGEFSTMSSTMTLDWNGGLDSMNTNFESFTRSMGDSLNRFTSSFTSGWTTMWRGIGNAFITQWNGIVANIESGMNSMIDSVNRVIREMNKISGLTGSHYSTISRIKIDRLKYMAEGGFVDEGQLFVARESGAEMVGSIGRKTAVANNDQIVESISSGVSVANDGVIAAICALMNVVEDKDFTVNIGDDSIGHSYDRYNRNRGVRVNTGAFANAY